MGGAPHAPHPLNPQLFTNVQLHVVSLRRNARHSSTTCIGVVNVRIETTLRLLRANEHEHSAGILIPRFLFCFFSRFFGKASTAMYDYRFYVANEATSKS